VIKDEIASMSVPCLEGKNKIFYSKNKEQLIEQGTKLQIRKFPSSPPFKCFLS